VPRHLQEYLVFARSAFEEPLAQRGSVRGDDVEGARAAALERFGDGWVELSLIPAADVRWILGPVPAQEDPGPVAASETGGRE
jgi:hypothetical protein